ncbi:HTH-transcriptional regulator, MarR family [Gottschalkia acidurici 9a]|uniref:HTH-transcriptional regulator, MarR family n=1 Tax=Gottschalkia acidurici (strain ATCC 7906 / DSM 604 / BCRC 14475 / CIP 104303 / KCTC 5404 / NCIMB 10678 / 9a) TaxID=1128398 RepID=K0AZZ0_GOTA9|nr:MarR family transcriptional regulator [Gottschalkia acidurici]AFS78290.1 HTH-transcriptional regulator, MarR family [Gottschalkia acidurici 9a]
MDSIGRFNAAIYRNAQSVINHKLKDLKISSGQQDFFYAISKNEGISQKELSEYLYVDKSTTAKAVKNLVENKYVKRKHDENDRRIYRLYLTEKGKEVIPKIEATFLEILDVFTKDLTEKEKEQTLENLKKILNSIYEEKRKTDVD